MESSCDVLIVGGGTGGVAAALACAALGISFVLTEETDWIGGQLTTQAVPPDEHPWIEDFGCTRRYRTYRNLVRQTYRDHRPLTAKARRDRHLNPGGGWVSRLCHEPSIGQDVLRSMLGRSGDVRFGWRAVSADGEGDRIRAVRFDTDEVVSAKFVLDATELGDLLPMTGTEFVVGAESREATGEPNAVAGPPQPNNVQGLTWVMAVALDEGSHRVIDRPPSYDRWRTYQPDFWPGPLLGFEVLHAHTGEPRTLPLFSHDWYALFPYRQIVDPSKFTDGPDPVTLVNWPQNDYFVHNIIEQPEGLEESRQLSLSLLYWLQTEAPRHDGGVGYPGLYLRPDITGTPDGLAKAPYIRESRRIQPQFTITETMVSTATNPGLDRAPLMPDSVGVGAYRIDLHPSASGAGTIDTSTLPFQIPLGALIPVRMQNLIPAAKNIGTTHITNGCYRLHPVEWNIGEVAGLLAAFCVQNRTDPRDVRMHRLDDFQGLLRSQGIELEWPRDAHLHAL